MEMLCMIKESFQGVCQVCNEHVDDLFNMPMISLDMHMSLGHRTNYGSQLVKYLPHARTFI